MKIEFEWNDLVDLVDEASADDINKIAHAISDIITVVNSNDGGNVDLSNYFTKEEVLQQLTDVLETSKYYSQNEASLAVEENKTNNIPDSLGSEKCPTVEAVHEYGQSLINSCNSFATDYVAQEIGNIETALENIIAKYGLGGDAT